MQHYSFRTIQDQALGSPYPICLLVPEIDVDGVLRHYLYPHGIDPQDTLVLDLHHIPHQRGRKKQATPLKEVKAYIEQELVPVLREQGVEYLLVADPAYFRALCGLKQGKVEARLGYVLDCVYGPWKAVYVPNHRLVFYDPLKVRSKIEQAMQAFRAHRKGTYQPPGQGIIQFEAYPDTVPEIARALDYLLALDVDLAIDIEGFGLKHWEAGIASISFAWSKTEGVAFLVDYQPIPGATEAPYGTNRKNPAVRALLRDFFERFQRTARWHHIAYDVYVLVYQLFMDDLLDTRGLLRGLEVLLHNWDCTRLIAYLATNSCSGNALSLKDQAQEYAGSYTVGESIKNVLNIPPDRLLRYNLIDTLCTHYVYEKHWDKLVGDQQLEFYQTIFKPATADVIQMQLTGLPIDMARVHEVERILEATKAQALQKMAVIPLVQDYLLNQNQLWVLRKNAMLVRKRVTLADADEVFNPGSSAQLQIILYEQIGLKVIERTDTGQPATDEDTLEKLQLHTQDPEVLAFLAALLEFKRAQTILSTFLPAFKNAQPGPDGWHYLLGNFNLGGTISGRLSSSDPNLTNIPAKSVYATLIKQCVVAPPGWVFVGIDFISLEDMISALTTKDPNRLKVFTDGYDSHSLKAFTYFPEEMPDIVDTVASINTIPKRYPDQRQRSKTVTFALTYAGTIMTLMHNCGFSRAQARRVYDAYHDLYKVSDQWVADKLNEAAHQGYITGAFGLRVRTPLLAQVIRGNSRTPYEAEGEGRSAGNALGQSWCLLNSRAASEFMGEVRNSAYALDVRPCTQIHDAQYYLVRDDVDLIAWVNEKLVAAVQWQDHPDIWHDAVRLGGVVTLYHPSWADEIKLPNDADAEMISDIVFRHSS